MKKDDTITTTYIVEQKIFSKLKIKNPEEINKINIPLKLVLECLDELKEEEQ